MTTMKRREAFRLLPILLLALSCSDLGDELEVDPEAELLEAFSGYDGWTRLPTDHVAAGALDGAHQGGDSTYTRAIYSNGLADGTGAAEGAALVCETFRLVDGERQWAPELGLLGMIKRSGGFAPSGGDWEWVELDTTGTAVRAFGANLAGGACVSCHSGAEDAGGVGFTFSLPPEDEPLLSYSAEIQPIFNAHCVSCHPGNGGLDLGSWTGVLDGGSSGPVVVAGNADGSWLVQRLEGAGGVMPPSGPLPAASIQAVRDWIEQGAQDN